MSVLRSLVTSELNVAFWLKGSANVICRSFIVYIFMRAHESNLFSYDMNLLVSISLYSIFHLFEWGTKLNQYTGTQQ